MSISLESLLKSRPLFCNLDDLRFTLCKRAALKLGTVAVLNGAVSEVRTLKSDGRHQVFEATESATIVAITP